MAVGGTSAKLPGTAVSVPERLKNMRSWRAQSAAIARSATARRPVSVPTPGSAS